MIDDGRIRHGELEQRCVEISAPVAAALEAAGYQVDVEVLVVAEIARVALARGVDVTAAIEYFESRGFVSAAVESIELAIA